jgi:hypothetical protein
MAREPEAQQRSGPSDEEKDVVMKRARMGIRPPNMEEYPEAQEQFEKIAMSAITRDAYARDPFTPPPMPTGEATDAPAPQQRQGLKAEEMPEGDPPGETEADKAANERDVESARLNRGSGPGGHGAPMAGNTAPGRPTSPTRPDEETGTHTSEGGRRTPGRPA